MSTTYIRFEVRLPIDMGTDAFGNISAQDIATRAFLSSMLTLIPNYTYLAVNQVSATAPFSQYNAVYGLLTAAQAATALGYLNTLNTALGYQLVCYTYNVVTQP